VDDQVSPPGSDESGSEKGITKKKSRSILSHLSNDKLTQSPNTSDKRYQLHAIINKKVMKFKAIY
jgi:hypothetical protein